MNTIIIKDKKATHVNITQYPDGQRNFTLDLSYFNRHYKTYIIARILNMNDFEILLGVVGALKRNDLVIESITFIYLFGQRSDRAFEPGMCNYTRDVLLPIIESMGVPYKVFYPHNDLLFQDCNYNFNPESVCEYRSVRLAADYGSVRRFGVPLYFEKIRDISGNIKLNLPRTTLDILENSDDKYEITVLDDLCDGGRTFEEAGKILKQKFPDRKLTLVIIHGIFSKGFDELLTYYDKIITTNSYQDFPQNPDDPFRIPETIEVIKVI